MARGIKKKVSPANNIDGPNPKCGVAYLRVRWPFLAFEDLEVTVAYKGHRMLLQVEDIDVRLGSEVVSGGESEH